MQVCGPVQWTAPSMLLHGNSNTALFGFAPFCAKCFRLALPGLLLKKRGVLAATAALSIYLTWLT